MDDGKSWTLRAFRVALSERFDGRVMEAYRPIDSSRQTGRRQAFCEPARDHERPHALQGIARAWLAAGGVLLVAGCASFDRRGTADSLNQTASLTRSLIRTDTFILTAFERTRDPAAPLVVYIEGDGLAWLSHFEPSMDPTPIHPIGLQLAATDPSPDLLYLARPCQYTPLDLDLRCNTDYWTDKRFAEEGIVAV
ncbi:MAG: hypothetical protein EXQ97_01950, partial [Alphaproteobacteria bacterium]|nr:hypothetical protein [Alphaproteobacteria bacterium]